VVCELEFEFEFELDVDVEVVEAVGAVARTQHGAVAAIVTVNVGLSTAKTIELVVWFVMVACAIGVVVVVVGGAVVVVVDAGRRARVVGEVAEIADWLLVELRPTHQIAPTPTSSSVPAIATTSGAHERWGRAPWSGGIGAGRFAVPGDEGTRARDAACCNASSARCWCSTDSSGVGAWRYQRRSAKTHSRATSTAMTTGIRFLTSRERALVRCALFSARPLRCDDRGCVEASQAGRRTIVLL